MIEQETRAKYAQDLNQKSTKDELLEQAIQEVIDIKTENEELQRKLLLCQLGLPFWLSPDFL